MGFVKPREPFSFISKRTKLPVIATPDQVFDADDPDIKGKEHLFTPVEVSVQRTENARAGRATETATSAPGEVRNLNLGPNSGGSGVGPANTEAQAAAKKAASAAAAEDKKEVVTTTKAKDGDKK